LIASNQNRVIWSCWPEVIG